MICLDDAQWATAGETVKDANEVKMMLTIILNDHILVLICVISVLFNIK